MRTMIYSVLSMLAIAFVLTMGNSATVEADVAKAKERIWHASQSHKG